MLEKKNLSTYEKFIFDKKIESIEKNSRKVKEFYPDTDVPKFIGLIRDGKRCGYGIEYHPNGRVKYSGNFKAGNIHGKDVKLYNENNTVAFEGDIIEGKKEGFGIMYHANGNCYYKGMFKKNKFEDINGKLYDYEGC